MRVIEMACANTSIMAEITYSCSECRQHACCPCHSLRVGGAVADGRKRVRSTPRPRDEHRGTAAAADGEGGTRHLLCASRYTPRSTSRRGCKDLKKIKTVDT